MKISKKSLNKIIIAVYLRAGKNPKGVDATALYKASLENREKLVQKRVAETAGTTEVTLRNRLKGLNSLCLTWTNEIIN